MKKGLIIKHISNQYQIKSIENNQVYSGLAKGRLRHVTLDEQSSFNVQRTHRTKLDKRTVQISPKVGDIVLFELVEGVAYIDEILPRKNDLNRPDVANVDQVLLLFSAIKPDFSFHLLDKFLIVIEQQNLTPIIVVTKIDLIEDNILNKLKNDLKYYETIGYDVYYINSKQKIGFDILKTIFDDKITVLAGQTGVGKSTLLNALMPELDLKTQEISMALGRGKHTTRNSELYSFGSGYIADTPGFSRIDFNIFEKEDLKEYYKDFASHSHLCRFKNSCLHLNEPGCEIKKVFSEGIMKERYNQYVVFLEEIINQKKTY